jgi:hypothetical protein
MPYPKDFNPKEELKKQGEKYAGWIRYGLMIQLLKDYETELNGTSVEDAVKALSAEFAGKPLWELWRDGKLTQFYLMQWAMQNGSAELKAVVRLVLRVTHLADVESGAATAIVEAFKADGGDAEVAKSALPALFAATRKYPFDSAAFAASLSPVLSAHAGASIACDQFFADTAATDLNMQWGYSLCKARNIVNQPKQQTDFVKVRALVAMQRISARDSAPHLLRGSLHTPPRLSQTAA